TCQWVSKTTTVSGRSRSSTSLRIRCRPETSVVSWPSFIARRIFSGSMIPGACDTMAASTTSPMSAPPAPGSGADVLQVRVEIEAPGAAFAADARLARSSEGGAQVAHEEAVDPDGARGDAGGHAFRAGGVAGVDHGDQAVAGLVGEGHGLFFVGE